MGITVSKKESAAVSAKEITLKISPQKYELSAYVPVPKELKPRRH